MADFPSPSSAYGRWGLMDVRDAVMGGNWPSPPAPATLDPYFPYVTMLLPGNGTNGAQNNTFLDSSVSPLTITRNGNTTQGTFSPYGSNWSNYFDGTGDYLTVANNTNISVGTGAFTIEAWVYRQGGNSDWRVMAGSVSGSGFFGGRDNKLGLGRSNVAWDLESSTNVYSNNAWTHIVYVRNGSNTLSIFSNGIRVATATNSNDYGLNSGALQVAAEQGDQTWIGNMSNFRLVKGTAVYDPTQTTLTVPTAPLTAVSGTGLLTCQSNRFIDNSSNAFTLTVNGNTNIQRFSPFSPTATYSANVIGGAAYFDGSGDSLVTSGAGSFNPRSTFTVEFWTYPITNSTVTWISSNTNGFFYIETFTGTLYIGDGSFNTISTTPPALNRWTHVLLSFDGTTYRLFYNGVSQATSTSLLASNTLTAFRVGQKNDASRPFQGYINDMRVLVGTALYTSAFTPPTAPLTAISNTVLLLSCTNAGIIDSAMMNNLETVGTAQISTSVVKYGTGSLAFDGTSGTYLLNQNYSSTAPPFQKFGLKFTMEMWVYRTNTATNQWLLCTGQGYDTATDRGFLIGYYTAYGSGSIAIAGYDLGAYWFGGSATLTANTWHHVAVVGDGTNCVLYLNGTNIGSQAWPGGYTGFNAYGWYVAQGRQTSGSAPLTLPFGGYIDDLRITNGIARYTGNFTPPTEAFPTS